MPRSLFRASFTLAFSLGSAFVPPAAAEPPQSQPPSEPAPSEPAPSEPVPSEPAPSESAPSPEEASTTPSDDDDGERPVPSSRGPHRAEGQGLPPSAVDAAELSPSTPRKRPDYSGREDPTTVGDVLLWVPRVVLFPAYLVSEALIRQPLGFLIAGSSSRVICAAAVANSA